MKEENKNVQIFSIEGKDLLTRYYRATNKSKRKGSLDDAIEVDKLKRVNKKIIKYDKKKRRYYTDDIITVTFKYACNQDRDLTDEEYERVESLKIVSSIVKKENELFNNNIEIEKVGLKEKLNKTKSTIRFISNISRDLTDEEFERVESLKIVIEVIKNEIKLLDKYIKSKKNKLKYIKELTDIASMIIDKNEIRRQLYVNGFNINIDGKNKHFARYKRTSGSARVGKCLFINSKYKKEMIDWSFAGINHDDGVDMDCAGMESYISLPTSSAIGRFKLNPNNILLIDDIYSEFEDTVMATRLINEEYDENGNIINGDLETSVSKKKIRNNLLDGEMILDKSIFEELGYEDKATLQLRNMLLKGIGVNTDIQLFFKDNNITDISQLNGRTTAKDIKDIKLIVTPSSVKYLKFGTFENWLKYIEEDFAICKYEKPQHHFNGMVQTHYQLLNTLGMSKESMREFLKDTIEYINLLKKDITVFKYHLGINSLAETEDDLEQKSELNYNIDSSNKFILNMLEINDDFQYTKMFKKFKTEAINSYINNIRKGHVLVEGNYSVIVSDPYQYLLASIGKFTGEQRIGEFKCVSNKFEHGEELLAVRSPEPTMSNICVLENKKDIILDTYFNTKSKEVCYISPINNNIMELLSSCDFDGDQFLISNNKILVEHAKKLQETIEINGEIIKRFLVSTDFTPKSSIKRKYTPYDLADTDIKCSQNKIGEIINLAQILNSLYWHKKYKGESEDILFELYKDISNLNILSCIEIDRAKKISPVDAKKELDKIRKKYPMGKGFVKTKEREIELKIRPHFFKYLEGGKDYSFEKFNTGMDYLNTVLDEDIKRDKRGKYLKLTDLLIPKKMNQVEINTLNKIKKIVKKIRERQQNVWMSDSENKYIEVTEIYNEGLERIKQFNITEAIVYNLLLRIQKSNDSDKYEEYQKISRLILKFIYDANKKSLINNIKVNKKNNEYLLYCDEGDIKLYKKPFKKLKI